MATPMTAVGRGAAQRLAAVVLAGAVSLLPVAGVAQTTANGAPAASAARADSGASAALVRQIAARLGHAMGVRARFTQTQTRAALRQPLVSTGSLVFLRERGAIWHIETPYVLTYVITDAGVDIIDANGTHSGGARGVAEVSRMMRELLGGDLSALYSQFEVSATGTAEQWQLDLTPSQPQLAQSIKTLQLGGGAYLQTLRMVLGGGDTTRIVFSDSQAIDTLTPAERTLLGAP